MASARYNSFRLPLLPEYDTAAYQLAVISFHDWSEVGTQSECWLTLLPANVPATTTESGGLEIKHEAGKAFNYRVNYPYEKDSAWESIGYVGENVDEFGILEGFTVWANDTITTEDGTVFLEGTDPIINADESFMLGIAVGMSLEGW